MSCNFVSSMILQVTLQPTLLIINVSFGSCKSESNIRRFHDRARYVSRLVSQWRARVRLGDSASSVRQLAEEMLKRQVEEAGLNILPQRTSPLTLLLQPVGNSNIFV